MLFWPSGADPFAMLRAGSEGRRYISTRGFAFSDQRTASSLSFSVSCLPSTVSLYRVTCVFSAQKPDGLLSIIAQLVDFRVKAVFFR
jgi:hypothetical protein